VQQQAQSAGASSARQEVAIYQVATDDNGSHLSKSVLPTVGAPGASRDAIAAGALDAMARSKRSPLPPGTRTRSVHIDGDGLATVDFNRAFHDNFPGGDEAEALTVNAVLATLGQFTGVARVQFLVEGQKIDSLGGTQSLESPLPVPQANEASSASGASDTAVARGEP
jgi:spore germination protein GerM